MSDSMRPSMREELAADEREIARLTKERDAAEADLAACRVELAALKRPTPPSNWPYPASDY